MKMTSYCFGSLLLVAASFMPATATETTAINVANAQKISAEKGKELYEKECVGCHGIELYVRENPNVKDYEGLKAQIQTCATNLGKPWFEKEIENVAAYLNEYYQFNAETAK